MAHVTITKMTTIGYIREVRKIPSWAATTTTQEALNLDVSGTLSGQLTVDSVAVSHGTVIVRYRSNDNLVARVRTNANGNWTSPHLEVGQAKYFAYAYTDGDYNVARLDKLAPV